MRVFSTDHKVIGLQYAVTSLLFLLLAFTFVLISAANSGWTSYPPCHDGDVRPDRGARGMLILQVRAQGLP